MPWQSVPCSSISLKRHGWRGSPGKTGVFLRRCSGETRELGRVADREDLLNVVVGDVQHQGDGRLAVEITDKAWFTVDFDKPRHECLRCELGHPAEDGSCDIGRAVDEVGQC